MQTLLQSEISFIEKIIANGKESFFVEFKEEYKSKIGKDFPDLRSHPAGA